MASLPRSQVYENWLLKIFVLLSSFNPTYVRGFQEYFTVIVLFGFLYTQGLTRYCNLRYIRKQNNLTGNVHTHKNHLQCQCMICGTTYYQRSSYLEYKRSISVCRLSGDVILLYESAVDLCVRLVSPVEAHSKTTDVILSIDTKIQGFKLLLTVYIFFQLVTSKLQAELSHFLL